MALSTRPWSRADLDRLPDDGNRYELLDGELLVSPPPSPEHQDIVEWLADKLFPFVQAHGLGRVRFPRTVVVIEGSQLEPDLSVRADGPGKAWQDKPLPILVIEILSRSTRERDLGKKRDFYVRKGIAEYWAIDRQERAVFRYTPTESETVRSTLTWAPKSIAATLEIDVAAMFGEAMGSAGPSPRTGD